MKLKPITSIPVCESRPQAVTCHVCTRLASNLPPSLLELVDILEAKPGAGRREILALAMILGYQAALERQL